MIAGVPALYAPIILGDTAGISLGISIFYSSCFTFC